ncbi:HNH endonuclease signature motif containing protein [Cellulomonas aerilata]|uniref:HNH nuclease domain-containing protein n=1 Tax=Cellulomonas aerilata TaxID=515326 RepID=A0A512DDM1_9CELL|nr:HNH endonuclease signature motif containing protein [Cellulomonas aerilata]GEO34576.1 hypothetical protein CAE01nite_23010 [Cellulomonas aerilata]
MADDDTPLDSAVLPAPDAVGNPALPPEVTGSLPAVLAWLDSLGSLSATDLDGRQAEAIATVLADVISRAGVAQARMLTVIEADGLWSISARSLSRYAARRFGTSVHLAQAQVRLGRALRDDLPGAAVAAASGEIGVEHAHVLAALAPTTELRRAALSSDGACNEAWLVEQARLLPVDEFRRCVRGWAAAADPDADDRGYVEASDRAYLEVAPTLNGYHVDGFLTVDDGQNLRTALEALTPVPAAGDQRSAGQRRAAALGALARRGLELMGTGKGSTVRTRVGVLVTHERLQELADRARATVDGRTPAGRAPARAPAPAPAPALSPRTVAHGPQFEDGIPVPRVLLDRLACDGELNRYIFGPTSEILDVGRAERTFTRARRNAIVARDRHCRYPGCTAPPLISECHHVQHWARDHGSTSVENGILLCFHHHRHVHHRGIEIRRRGARWVFTDAAGRELADLRPDGDDDGWPA